MHCLSDIRYMGFLDESTLSAFQTQIPRRYVFKFFFIKALRSCNDQHLCWGLSHYDWGPIYFDHRLFTFYHFGVYFYLRIDNPNVLKHINNHNLV